MRSFVQNGAEPSRARRFGAALRTLDGECRSERIEQEGKEELNGSVFETRQARRLRFYVSTIILSETRGL